MWSHTRPQRSISFIQQRPFLGILPSMTVMKFRQKRSTGLLTVILKADESMRHFQYGS